MHPAPFTIADVGDILQIRRLDGGNENSFNVECPFCGDKRGKCNFSVIKKGTISNVYQCFNCGAQGNMLTLYADLKGLWGSDRYKEAYRQIRDQLQYGQQETKERQMMLHQRAQMQKESHMERADGIKRDKVYRALIQMLHLSEHHQNDLRRRGQTEEEIKHMEVLGYVSTESNHSVSIARRLIKQGFDLEGIPGFFINYGGDWEISFYKKNEGYLCPVWSEDGLLVAFQIRLDQPYKKRKYIWLTSSNLKNGCSSGSPVSISGDPYASRIYVTEGILKAEIAHQCSGRTYLGNPGVANHRELWQVLRKLKKRGLKEVIECYDMDKLLDLKCHEDYDASCPECEQKGVTECPRKRVKRDNIRKGCIKLYRMCEDLSIPCRRMCWDYDENGIWLENYKGCDDWEMKDRISEAEQMAA